METKVNTGGSAFPVQSVYIEDQEKNSLGMTLRDYFAAKAMQGKLASGAMGYNDIAEHAYKYADAMLKARGQ